MVYPHAWKPSAPVRELPIMPRAPYVPPPRRPWVATHRIHRVSHAGVADVDLVMAARPECRPHVWGLWSPDAWARDAIPGYTMDPATNRWFLFGWPLHRHEWPTVERL